MSKSENKKEKSVFVSIVGRPNVGKSSLLNYMVGEKIAIVTNKPQTTRTRITGILTKNETQFVFFDTPGFHKAKTKLSEYMLKSISNTVSDVDVTLFVTNATDDIRTSEQELLKDCKTSGVPVILVLNKIDLLSNKEKMLEKIVKMTEDYNFAAVVPVCALNGDGVEDLMGEIEKYANEGPHFFDDDSLTDQPEKIIAGEIIREKILMNMDEEIPHGIGVSIEKMKDRKNLKTGAEILDIEATIMCERASHKGMIIGKGGTMLKKIASSAREDIEEFLQIKVNLQCWVKVKEDWRNREDIIKSLGFTKD